MEDRLFVSSASSEGHEAFKIGHVVAGRTDGTVRVRTDMGERVWWLVRVGVDAWPAPPAEADEQPEPSGLCSVELLQQNIGPQHARSREAGRTHTATRRGSGPSERSEASMR